MNDIHLKKLIKEEIKKLLNENSNPLMPFIKDVPLSGESMKDFLEIARTLEISQLQEIIPHMESKRKFYSAGTKMKTMVGIYNRKRDMLKNFIDLTKSLISTKQKEIK